MTDLAQAFPPRYGEHRSKRKERNGDAHTLPEPGTLGTVTDWKESGSFVIGTTPNLWLDAPVRGVVQKKPKKGGKKGG